MGARLLRVFPDVHCDAEHVCEVEFGTARNTGCRDAVPDCPTGFWTLLGGRLEELQRHLRCVGNACRVRHLDLRGMGRGSVGCRVSNTAQHFHPGPIKRNRLQYARNIYLNDSDVITLFLIVAEHFNKGRGACPTEQVVLISGVSEDVVDQCLSRFKAARLIYEVEGDTVGFMPARALGSITLQQVVDAVESDMTVPLADGLPSPEGERVLDGLRESQREHLEQVTVASLL